MEKEEEEMGERQWDCQPTQFAQDSGVSQVMALAWPRLGGSWADWDSWSPH